MSIVACYFIFFSAKISMKKLVFILLLDFVFLSSFCNAQDSTQRNQSANFLPFCKWEVGVDLLPLVDKLKDPFGLILKRNFNTSNGIRALRLKIYTQASFAQAGRVDSGYVWYPTVYLATGYEWQKLYGKFSFLYGGEFFVKHSLNKIESRNGVSQTSFTYFGSSVFAGGRYQIASHIFLTLESHFIYQYQDIRGENIGNISSFSSRGSDIRINPIHAFYLNYSF